MPVCSPTRSTAPRCSASSSPVRPTSFDGYGVEPRLTLTVRVGWEWQTVDGSAELLGPLDPHPSAEVDVPELLRAVFRAAGGTHPDWAEYDRVMADEQRTAVLVTPTRVYGNAGD